MLNLLEPVRFALATGLAFLLLGCHQGDHAPAATAPVDGPKSVSVRDAWVRATPPGAEVAAGYFTLENPTSTPLRLMSVTSPSAGRVEIHEMRHVDGMMQMRQLSDGVIADPGSQIVLAPGGLHLMLFDLVAPMVEGEQVQLQLQLSASDPLIIDVPVLRGPPSEAADPHAHH